MEAIRWLLARSSDDSFDALGRLQTVRNPAGDTARTEYDDLNRVIKQVDGLGGVTLFEHDDLFLIKVTNTATSRSGPTAGGRW